MSTAPHPCEPFGLDHLLAAPEDGYRYEVIDGSLVVNAAPSWRHQQIVLRLATLLSAAAPQGVVVLPAPVWVIGPGQIPEPDLVVVEEEKLGRTAVEGTPLLVVEVLSPFNRGSDLVRKRALYAEAGCPSYWLVEPEPVSVTVLELCDGIYEDRARAEGGETLNVLRPFPLTLEVDRL